MLLLSGVSQAQNILPDSLTKGANIIKKQEEIVFEIRDVDEAKLNVHQVYTVLNADGERALVFQQLSNKAMVLDEAVISMYDAQGKVITKMKKKDIYKQAVLSGLADDDNFYHNQLKPPAYPVTVEYAYQVLYRGTLWYPDYEIAGDQESVIASSFTVKVPATLDLRYKNQAIGIEPKMSQEGSNKIYQWSVQNLAPIRLQEKGMSADGCYPAVMLAPNRFRLYNSAGDMSTWKKFGEWEQGLTTGLETLSEERKAFFVNLVKNAANDREKVAAVYDYLQKNFRYVSIQLGIGGFKPFPAAFTDEKKYGDCKGLSFYTHSVLKAIGVKSHVALINAGHNKLPVDPLFPTSNFNHMILCVPQVKDTLWLECTSQDADFNFLGSFTENRYALLITDNGGVLVRTPVSDPARNSLKFTSFVQLNADGSGITKTNLSASGDLKSQLRAVEAEKHDVQKEYFVHNLGFKQPDDFSFARNEQKDYLLQLSIEKIPEFMAGSKMFLAPSLHYPGAVSMPAADNRKQDYYFGSVLQYHDTTVFQLPEGYTKDVFPKVMDIADEYANYRTLYSYDEQSNRITSIRSFCIRKNKVPAADYVKVKKVFDSILADATQKIIIKKN